MKTPSFPHPEVVSNCMSLFLLLNTKADMMKNVGDQTVDGKVNF